MLIKFPKTENRFPIGFQTNSELLWPKFDKTYEDPEVKYNPFANFRHFDLKDQENFLKFSSTAPNVGTVADGMCVFPQGWSYFFGNLNLIFQATFFTHLLNFARI